MNLKIITLFLMSVLPGTIFSADWEAIAHTPAQIEVLDMQARPLVESKEQPGWAKVPAAMAKYGGVIYMPGDSKMGVADITVTADGYLLVACNYDYQGNKGGDWHEEIWDEKKFKTKGWHLLSKHEMDGELVKSDNRLQMVFSKQVHKGEKLRIRCNKYDPPFPILVGAKSGNAK